MQGEPDACPDERGREPRPAAPVGVQRARGDRRARRVGQAHAAQRLLRDPARSTTEDAAPAGAPRRAARRPVVGAAATSGSSDVPADEQHVDGEVPQQQAEHRERQHVDVALRPELVGERAEHERDDGQRQQHAERQPRPAPHRGERRHRRLERPSRCVARVAARSSSDPDVARAASVASWRCAALSRTPASSASSNARASRTACAADSRMGRGIEAGRNGRAPGAQRRADAAVEGGGGITAREGTRARAKMPDRRAGRPGGVLCRSRCSARSRISAGTPSSPTRSPARTRRSAPCASSPSTAARTASSASAPRNGPCCPAACGAPRVTRPSCPRSATGCRAAPGDRGRTTVRACCAALRLHAQGRGQRPNAGRGRQRRRRVRRRRRSTGT